MVFRWKHNASALDQDRLRVENSGLYLPVLGRYFTFMRFFRILLAFLFILQYGFLLAQPNEKNQSLARF
jgi:hypothetical protein